MKDIYDSIDKLFGSSASDKPKVAKPPKSTDTPDIRLFMFQLLNSYVRLVNADGMRWSKKLRNKENGKVYSIKIEIMEEIEI